MLVYYDIIRILKQNKKAIRQLVEAEGEKVMTIKKGGVGTNHIPKKLPKDSQYFKKRKDDGAKDKVKERGERKCCHCKHCDCGKKNSELDTGKTCPICNEPVSSGDGISCKKCGEQLIRIGQD
ncbi:MAG: hypothetical protein M1334_00780 [Patescibacteria group bacterium]|nr:hypothetical protein [Patescibacteria group bacterium]